MKFDDLEFKPHPMGFGEQAIVEFPNGYGASIVKISYNEIDITKDYEIGLLKDGALSNIKCDFANDNIITNLTKDGVIELLEKIEKI